MKFVEKVMLCHAFDAEGVDEEVVAVEKSIAFEPDTDTAAAWGIWQAFCGQELAKAGKVVFVGMAAFRVIGLRIAAVGDETQEGAQCVIACYVLFEAASFFVRGRGKFSVLHAGLSYVAF